MSFDQIMQMTRPVPPTETQVVVPETETSTDLLDGEDPDLTAEQLQHVLMKMRQRRRRMLLVGGNPGPGRVVVNEQSLMPPGV